jgi:hypothetical protein
MVVEMGGKSSARKDELTASKTKNSVRTIAAGIFDLVKNGLTVKDPDMSSCNERQLFSNEVEGPKTKNQKHRQRNEARTCQ